MAEIKEGHFSRENEAQRKEKDIEAQRKEKEIEALRKVIEAQKAEKKEKEAEIEALRKRLEEKIQAPKHHTESTVGQYIDTYSYRNYFAPHILLVLGVHEVTVFLISELYSRLMSVQKDVAGQIYCVDFLFTRFSSVHC